MHDRCYPVKGGLAIWGDSTALAMVDCVLSRIGAVPLIVADPPYGRVLYEEWDRTNGTARAHVAWMLKWTRKWRTALLPGGAFYVWGGIGTLNHRPFFAYLSEVEMPDEFELANLITWSKKRAYGVPNNYLFTREECAYFVRGNAKKPRCFIIPLLETKRGYPGYLAGYPAKSEFLRRTNVWTDITEILRGKRHAAQKKQRVIEIPIEVHTHPGEWVVDPFAGSGTTAHAARRLDRQFVVIEKDRATFDAMVDWLQAT